MLGEVADVIAGDRYKARQNEGRDALLAAHSKGDERRDRGHARMGEHLSEGEAAKTGNHAMGEKGRESDAYETGFAM